jgi:phytoene dehydrogenase-like protein
VTLRRVVPSVDADACIIGAGPNGLVASIALADAGWDVVLVEGSHLGGAVRSVRRRPETVTDLFSAFYPLGAASPVLRALELDRHGLEWSHAEVVLAHPADEKTTEAAALYRDVRQTAKQLDHDHPGDGERWQELFAEWQRLREPLLDALFSPFPPIRPAARLARLLGLADGLRLARFLLLPVRRMGEELFRGEHGRLLLTGNALHADVPLTAPVSGTFGWLLAMLGQDVGFPAPRGGAGALSDALARRARAAGVEILLGTPVEDVLVAGGRAVGARLADGRLIRSRRAVLAAIDAETLLRELVPSDALPRRLVDDLDHFDRDLPTVKVNWTLPRTPQWRADPARRSGVLHIGADTDGAVRWSEQIERGELSDRPFMLVGQMTTADPSRSSDGSESLWAYTHLPRGYTVRNRGADAVSAAVADTVARMEEVLYAHAPGFADGAIDRFVQGPSDLAAVNPNLVDGGVGGGTSQLHQQLVFRPVPGLSRPELPIENLYLAGASAHPGGGVHGASGWNAARACLANHGLFGGLRRRSVSAVLDRLYRDRRSAG